MTTDKAVKLVNIQLDLHGYTQSSKEAVVVWLRNEVGNINIAYDLLETQVDQLMHNKWAVGRLYLTEKRLGLGVAA